MQAVIDSSSLDRVADHGHMLFELLALSEHQSAAHMSVT